jgi:flagellar motor switch protein FliN/FliY
LNADQTAAVGAYGDLMASTQREMIGTFLATEAKVSRNDLETLSGQDLVERAGEKVVLCKFPYSGALRGPTALVFKEADAAKMGGIMVGDSDATEFSEMVADAFREVVNTILGNLNAGLGEKARGSVSTTQIDIEKIEATATALSAAVGGEDPMVTVPYTLSVGADLNTEFWQVLSGGLVDSLQVLVAPPPAPKSAAPAAAKTAAAPRAAPVEFESLTEEPRTAPPPNLNLIMDIGLGVRVELGRTHMKIRDILNLGSGSVVELDKLAGEPVDLLVNDVIFAKGEVVVIDENFGVRITDILSLNDRIKTLGERKS